MTRQRSGREAARQRQQCVVCRGLIQRGERVGLVLGEPSHARCRVEAVRRAAILDGATFAAQAPSRWRR